MDTRIIKKNILVELSNDEALVLLNWLSRFNEIENSNLFEDQSEERILWDLESVLEKVVTTTFKADYKETLSSAREKLRDKK